MENKTVSNKELICNYPTLTHYKLLHTDVTEDCVKKIIKMKYIYLLFLATFCLAWVQASVSGRLKREDTGKSLIPLNKRISMPE